jgi:hypothetical protein
MEQFSINGNEGFVKVTFLEVYGFPDSIFFWGGYDLKAAIQIKAGNFFVESELFTATGELHDLFQSLKQCNRDLLGTIGFKNYDRNFEITIKYGEFGHIDVSGWFTEFNECENELKFNFTSDQTFIAATLFELAAIVNKYGDRKGLNVG